MKTTHIAKVAIMPKLISIKHRETQQLTVLTKVLSFCNNLYNPFLPAVLCDGWLGGVQTLLTLLYPTYDGSPLDIIIDSLSQSIFAGGLARTTHRIWGYGFQRTTAVPSMPQLSPLHSIIYLIVIVECSILGHRGVLPGDAN